MSEYKMRMIQERFARVLRDFIGDDIVVDHMAHYMAEATKTAALEFQADIARRQSCTLPSRLT